MAPLPREPAKVAKTSRSRKTSSPARSTSSSGLQQNFLRQLPPEWQNPQLWLSSGIVESAVEAAADAALVGWWLLLIYPGSPPWFGCYRTVEELAEAVSELSDDPCRVLVIHGRRHLLSAGPHRYLLRDPEEPVPLFVLPVSEQLLAEEESLLGRGEELFWNLPEHEAALDEIELAAAEEAAELAEMAIAAEMEDLTPSPPQDETRALVESLPNSVVWPVPSPRVGNSEENSDDDNDDDDDDDDEGN